MRGALGVLGQVTGGNRIIPADAGSTVLVDEEHPAGQDHPRGCGEHAVTMALSSAMSGSSPRMRGALLDMRVDSRYGGIIPADAGSTSLCG